ncbi:Thioredoxin [Escovopsis weberi]|uniref:Thioredoxin n=1 Tax=Escovopsis weberi TaxID=150374 RepID=A0A0M8N6V3_ESCWE|nr:Thioredoxin [Escovopsis weberi]
MAPPSEHVLDVKTKSDFQSLLSSNRLLVLQATASWCGPCKAISPLYNKHATTHADKPVRFLRFDIDEDPELCQELGIRSVPAFFFFEDGAKVHSVVGAVPPSLEKGITDLVAKVLE